MSNLELVEEFLSKKNLDGVDKFLLDKYIDAIKSVLEENKQIINMMAKTIKELNDKSEDVDCFIPKEYSNVNKCVKKNSCEECIIEYFKQQCILKPINDLGENFKKLAKEVFIKEGLFNDSDVEVYVGGKRLVKEVNKPDEPRKSD